MLCLTARDGDYFMIGDDVMVMFLKSKGSSLIKVGISAPKALPIRRDKIFEQELGDYVNSSKTPQEIFKALEIVEDRKKDKERARAEMERRAERIDRQRKAALRRAEDKLEEPASASAQGI